MATYTRPVYLRGTIPGLLDPTQPARVLYDADTTLSFANFDPFTATGSGPRSDDENSSTLKRIVIETTKGRSRWRFVPTPRCAPGAEIEGSWPKYLTILGQNVICTEEQWDIYNLDPAYECFVLRPPYSPVVYRKSTADPTRSSTAGQPPPPSESNVSQEGSAASALLYASYTYVPQHATEYGGSSNTAPVTAMLESQVAATSSVLRTTPTLNTEPDSAARTHVLAATADKRPVNTSRPLGPTAVTANAFERDAQAMPALAATASAGPASSTNTANTENAVPRSVAESTPTPILKSSATHPASPTTMSEPTADVTAEAPSSTSGEHTSTVNALEPEATASTIVSATTSTSESAATSPTPPTVVPEPAMIATLEATSNTSAESAPNVSALQSGTAATSSAETATSPVPPTAMRKSGGTTAAEDTSSSTGELASTVSALEPESAQKSSTESSATSTSESVVTSPAPPTAVPEPPAIVTLEATSGEKPTPTMSVIEPESAATASTESATTPSPDSAATSTSTSESVTPSPAPNTAIAEPPAKVATGATSRMSVEPAPKVSALEPGSAGTSSTQSAVTSTSDAATSPAPPKAMPEPVATVAPEVTSSPSRKPCPTVGALQSEVTAASSTESAVTSSTEALATLPTPSMPPTVGLEPAATVTAEPTLSTSVGLAPAVSAIKPESAATSTSESAVTLSTESPTLPIALPEPPVPMTAETTSNPGVEPTPTVNVIEPECAGSSSTESATTLSTESTATSSKELAATSTSTSESVATSSAPTTAVPEPPAIATTGATSRMSVEPAPTVSALESEHAGTSSTQSAVTSTSDAATSPATSPPPSTAIPEPSATVTAKATLNTGTGRESAPTVGAIEPQSTATSTLESTAVPPAPPTALQDPTATVATEATSSTGGEPVPTVSAVEHQSAATSIPASATTPSTSKSATTDFAQPAATMRILEPPSAPSLAAPNASTSPSGPTRVPELANRNSRIPRPRRRNYSGPEVTVPPSASRPSSPRPAHASKNVSERNAAPPVSENNPAQPSAAAVQQVSASLGSRIPRLRRVVSGASKPTVTASTLVTPTPTSTPTSTLPRPSCSLPSRTNSTPSAAPAQKRTRESSTPARRTSVSGAKPTSAAQPVHVDHNIPKAPMNPVPLQKGSKPGSKPSPTCPQQASPKVPENAKAVPIRADKASNASHPFHSSQCDSAESHSRSFAATSNVQASTPIIPTQPVTPEAPPPPSANAYESFAHGADDRHRLFTHDATITPSSSWPQSGHAGASASSVSHATETFTEACMPGMYPTESAMLGVDSSMAPDSSMFPDHPDLHPQSSAGNHAEFSFGEPTILGHGFACPDIPSLNVALPPAAFPWLTAHTVSARFGTSMYPPSQPDVEPLNIRDEDMNIRDEDMDCVMEDADAMAAPHPASLDSVVDHAMSDDEDASMAKLHLPDRDEDDDDDVGPNPQKRPRIGPKISKEEAAFKQRLSLRREALRQQRLRKLASRQPGTRDVFTEFPPGMYPAWGDSAASCSEPVSPDDVHWTKLEESKRKLADLEKDRPLWDQAKRLREAQERAEAEDRRARAEDKRRVAEEKAAAVAAAAAATAAAAAAAAAAAPQEQPAAWEHDDYLRVEEYLHESRQRQAAEWQAIGPWTDQHALKRYEELSVAFDAAKFSTANPPDFYEIPWPVIYCPNSTQPADINWTNVEAFFSVVRRHMTSAEYYTFIKRSHKRFHPDRWRARGIVKAWANLPLMQKYIEEAGNYVAQAVTPIWKEVRAEQRDADAAAG